MPYGDDPHHHRAKLADLVEYYDAARSDAVKALVTLHRTQREAAAHAVARVKADVRRAGGLFLWTIMLAGWGGGLLAWSEALLHRTSEPTVPTVDPYCAVQIAYERSVCEETVERAVDTQLAADAEFDREIQHALRAYQTRAQQMPACFPFIPSRGDTNVITETLPSGTVITYTRDDAPPVETAADCEARFHRLEAIANSWAEIYVEIRDHGRPSRGQLHWLHHTMHVP